MNRTPDGNEITNASITGSLLQRVKSHEDGAWDRLVFLYGPLVYNWCRREGLSHEEAEDAGQDVFRAVFNGIEKFRREKPGDTFRGWLWTISRNKIVDRFRAKGSGAKAIGGTTMKNVLDQVADEPDNESVAGHADTDGQGIAHRALELIKVEFRENSWKAFWLTTVELKSAADVAEQLGMNVGAVYTAKSRVLSRLRQELSDLEESLFT